MVHRNEVADELRSLLNRPLTQREREVLPYLLQGASNQQIATALGLCVSTTKVHIAALNDKLAANGRGEIVYLALLLGLVEVPSDPSLALRAFRARTLPYKEAPSRKLS